MASNGSKNVFEGLYHSSKDTIDQIKQAYSSPKECVHSYWCLIPMIFVILFGIFILLVIYYFLMNIIRSCCCCCFLCRPSTYARSQPTVLVQPTVVPQYPVWYPERMDDHQRMDMYYHSLPKHTAKPLPQRSPWRKKELENNKKMHLIFNKKNPENFHYGVNNLESKENFGEFWADFEVESPKENNVLVDSREYLSELSVNSNYSYYGNSNQVSDEDLKSIYYSSNVKSYPDTLDRMENRSYSPDIYNKNRCYSGI
ncbi:hypothetical protein PNEG_02390 [Pneumocystis murina B123]|uniref:Uncharacterized protein n=1 Tax=Pneumocystis murina (strain B123) TaxID=1069680 RepID=M7NLA4_PNEMU|nr:hypothetical protein PNEG_02390 [Pneumocystis murina B123]EMR09448.1 hypothetical protein PNEG_02390 [Pneumocystis murina B123]